MTKESTSTQGSAQDVTAMIEQLSQIYLAKINAECSALSNAV